MVPNPNFWIFDIRHWVTRFSDAIYCKHTFTHYILSQSPVQLIFCFTNFGQLLVLSIWELLESTTTYLSTSNCLLQMTPKIIFVFSSYMIINILVRYIVYLILSTSCENKLADGALSIRWSMSFWGLILGMFFINLATFGNNIPLSQGWSL